VVKMNEYQMKLYESCIKKVEEMPKSFYKKDIQLDGCNYRIFNYYQFAKFSDYNNFFEIRGHTFEIKEDCPIRLVTLPLPKFFNINENEMMLEKNLDFSKIKEITVKYDGSLLATYKTGNSFGLKTKLTFDAEQVVFGMSLLRNNPSLFDEINQLVQSDHTVCVEFCAPFNQVVLKYDSAFIKVICVRNNLTGEFLFKDCFSPQMEIVKNWVDIWQGREPIKNFILNVAKQKNIEGYVVRFRDNFFMKVKTEDYMILHNSLSHFNVYTESNKWLLKTILSGQVDDLKSILKDFPEKIKTIDCMNETVREKYFKLQQDVESFYAENKSLSRKDYAVKGTRKQPFIFSLLINKYLGKEIDYMDFMLKRLEWSIGEKDFVPEGSK